MVQALAGSDWGLEAQGVRTMSPSVCYTYENRSVIVRYSGVILTFSPLKVQELGRKEDISLVIGHATYGFRILKQTTGEYWLEMGYKTIYISEK
jgi:hypothetical protein